MYLTGIASSYLECAGFGQALANRNCMWSNRLVAVTMGLLLVVGITAPAHAGIRLERRARATFLLPERDGVRPAIFVEVNQMNEGDDYTGFALRRGVCRADGSRCVIMGGFVGELQEGDVFDVDEDLARAYLKVTRDGQTHTVTWRQTDDARPAIYSFDCGLYPGNAVGVARDASARGTIFGHRLGSREQRDVSLEALAYTC